MKKRKPYRTPKFTHLGKHSEIDYELLVILSCKPLITPPNLQDDRKAHLDRLVQLGLADSNIDKHGHTKYTIIEFGK